MKRAGFTMIELIFVIVILGILAAVAIPKLAATRDDARIAKGASELATAMADLGSYYTSKGSFGDLDNMTNVFPGDATDFNTTGNSVTFEGCISLVTINSGGGAGGADGINLRYTHAGSTKVCRGIAGASAKLFGQASGWTPSADTNMSHTFGGSSVRW